MAPRGCQLRRQELLASLSTGDGQVSFKWGGRGGGFKTARVFVSIFCLCGEQAPGAQQLLPQLGKHSLHEVYFLF